MKNLEKIYLPGLNGIRAIAAFAVVVSHTNGHLNEFGLQKIRYWDLANFGVTIFFTLSGFLITFLLLKEIEKSGKVNIKKFYVRRILRIWPLYYFYLFLILSIVGYASLGKTFFMYLLILPNIANGFVTYNAFPWEVPVFSIMFLIGHYWSLGVEEQFYSFWPWVIKKVKSIFIFLLLFPILFLIIKVVVKYTHLSEVLQFILHYSRFGCLAVGALGAYLFAYKNHWLTILKNPFIQTLPWLLLVLIAFNKYHIFSIIDHEILSIFIVILIVNQISEYKALISLENPVLDYLGKISFGIYVYNPLVIYLLYKVSQSYINLQNSTISYGLVYFAVLLFNIIFAHISYYTLEKYFLKLKSNYITVKSVASRQEYKENA